MISAVWGAFNNAPFFPTTVFNVQNGAATVDIDAVDTLDSEGAGLTYALTNTLGTATDNDKFTFDANTGILTFITPADLGNPGDANTDGIYTVEVTATDSSGLSNTQAIRVQVQTAPGGVTPGLTTWFRADAGVYSDAGTTAITTTGTDNVQAWHEQTGNAAFSGNQPQQTSTGNKPSYQTDVVNFNPSLYFEGSNDQLRTINDVASSALRSGDAATVYAVFTRENGSQVFDHESTGSQNLALRYNSASLGQSNNSSFTTDVGTEFGLVSSVRTAGGGLTENYLNGLANGGETDNDNNLGIDQFVIGVSNGNGNDLTGHIAGKSSSMMKGIPTRPDRKLKPIWRLSTGLR